MVIHYLVDGLLKIITITYALMYLAKGKCFNNIYVNSKIYSKFFHSFDYDQLKQAVKDYNNNYGGKLPHITNAVFSNGLLDSDYAFGITADEEEWDAYVINIAGKYTIDCRYTLINLTNESFFFPIFVEVGKSADFMKNSDKDTASLVLAKYSIEQLLVEWVKRD